MSELTFKDWMEVLAALATAGGLLYLMYGDYFKRPILEVSFVPKRDVISQGNTPDPFQKGNSFHRSIWIRVCVVNRKGRRVAKNARAFLTGAQPLQGTIGFRDEGRPLPWQNDLYDPMSRDLHPGVINRVDVAYTFEGLCGGIPTCAQPVFGLTDGYEYRVAIQVTADEADPVTIYLLIRWDGTDWKSVSAVEASPGTWVE